MVWMLSEARVHVASASNPLEAGRIVASSLLISHGVRREVLAAVYLEWIGVWLLAHGSRVRRLWPDADAVEGWVRAVLRGARLGARLEREPRLPQSGLCVYTGDWRAESLEAAGLSRTAFYDSTGGVECIGRMVLPHPRWLAPAVVNILWDRLEAGLRV